jgi:MFS family permease
MLGAVNAETATQNRVLVWVLIISQFAPPFMFSGVAVLLPQMGADLQAGATSLGLIETLFLAGQLSFLLPVGRLADAADKRTLYKIGLFAFAFFSLAIGLLSWLPGILTIRFFQGVTSAVFATTGTAILADLVPAKERGAAFGRAIGAVYVGLTIGPIVAGYLISLWGWRSVFIFGAAVLFVGAVMVQVMMPSGWKRPENVVHKSSTGLMLATVLSLVAGTAALREGQFGGPLIVFGILLGIVFVLVQKRVDRPLVDVRALMANRPLRGALLIQMLLYMNAFTSIFMMSIYMQVTLGHQAQTSGQVLAVGSVIMAVMAPIAGSLSDRYSPNRISTIGVSLVMIMALLALTLQNTSTLVLVIAVLVLQGLGFALFSSPNMALIMNSVPPTQVGMASALSAKARSLGMMSGMLVTGLLISLEMGNDPVEQHADRFIVVMHSVYAILAGLSALALFLSWRRTRA